MRLQHITEDLQPTGLSNENDPDILVRGIGQYKLSYAIRNVQQKLEDLHKRANGPTTLENWRTIDLLIKKETLQAFIDGIANGLAQLEQND